MQRTSRTAISVLRNYTHRETIELAGIPKLQCRNTLSSRIPQIQRTKTSKRPFTAITAMSMSTKPPSSSQRTKYAWREGVENLEGYCPGGYHPVTLETTFKSGRYHIVHKLGHGSYSTVWLARDTVEERYVSVKVLIAGDPKASSVEASIRTRLRAGDPTHPGRTHVQQLLDEFIVEGPNGTHAVLVSEVLGPTAFNLKLTADNEVLPTKVARRLTGQLALGLAYVHQCGIMHGDLHSKNVATTLPSLDDWPVPRIYSTFYGKPKRQRVMRLDGQPIGPEVPPYSVRPVWFWNLGIENLSDGVKILDFGEASLSDNSGSDPSSTSAPRTSLNTPPPFRAPEAMFNEPVGPPADVWAFGCTVFDVWCQGDTPGMLLNPCPDFMGFNRSVDGVLSYMVPLLGKLPKRWWKEWKMRQAFFADDGSPIGLTNADAMSLAARVASARQSVSGEEEMGDADREGLLALLEGCLKYEPGDRFTAEEIMRNVWIRKCLE